MRYAVFADIHGNLEALEVAVEYTKKRRVSGYFCLGDSIGYGANPNECLNWAFENAKFHVLGNHEAAVTDQNIRECFSGEAHKAIDWTANRLKSELMAGIKKLPYSLVIGKATLAHGALHSPEEFHYLFDENDAYKSFLALRSTLGFVGHTHVPYFFDEVKRTSGRLQEGVFRLQKNGRYLLNPGSIGQPRDGDRRLSFGIFDGDELTFEIVRLPYDNKKTAEKIMAEGLPPGLAYRLL